MEEKEKNKEEDNNIEREEISTKENKKDKIADIEENINKENGIEKQKNTQELSSLEDEFEIEKEQDVIEANYIEKENYVNDKEIPKKEYEDNNFNNTVYSKKNNINEKTRKILGITIIILLTFVVGVIVAFFVVYKCPDFFEIVVTKIEKDVTVTDIGIADAVDKVYNSVIVVTTYKQGTAYSNGSGFIYKVDGDTTYLITNHHVVEGGDSYKITYTDSEVLEATLVGSNEYSDIAVLKVKTKEDYKAVEIGSSEDMRVGDTTFTIGAPLDNTYSWTVTRGILSGKERLVEVSLTSSTNSDYIIKVLQTDAAVNSGNSGGPIANSNGEVIGVINAKISSTGVEGIGFAIPIEEAVEKAEELINGEESQYPYLGISMFDVETARSYPTYKKYLSNSDITSGVIVIDVEEELPADEAGIQSGDIIIKLNNKNTSNVAYLRYELYKNNINDTIEVTVIRNGEEKTVNVKLSLKLQKS